MRDQQVNENRQMFQEENLGWVGQGEGLNAASYLPFWYTAGGHSLLMGRRRRGIGSRKQISEVVTLARESCVLLLTVSFKESGKQWM